MGSVTRVVAINSQLLPRLAPTADRVILLDHGTITYNGPPGLTWKTRSNKFVAERPMSSILEEVRDSKRAEHDGKLPAGHPVTTKTTSAIAICAAFFRRAWLWTLLAGITILASQALEPLAMVFLSEWVAGKYVLEPAVFFGLFVVLIVCRTMATGLADLCKSLGNSQVAASIRIASDKTLVSLSMQVVTHGM
jgi:hypothetical protein